MILHFITTGKPEAHGWLDWITMQEDGLIHFQEQKCNTAIQNRLPAAG